MRGVPRLIFQLWLKLSRVKGSNHPHTQFLYKLWNRHPHLRDFLSMATQGEPQRSTRERRPTEKRADILTAENTRDLPIRPPSAHSEPSSVSQRRAKLASVKTKPANSKKRAFEGLHSRASTTWQRGIRSRWRFEDVEEEMESWFGVGVGSPDCGDSVEFDHVGLVLLETSGFGEE